MFPVAVARLALVVARLVKRVETDPERVESLPERERISPVAVARFVWRERMFPVAVARLEFVVARLAFVVAILPVALVMFVSWRVLVHWSFWIAWRRESDDVTVPAVGVNPVRTEARARALVK